MSTREDWQRRLGPLYGGAVALVHSTPWRWPLAIERDDTRQPAWIVALGLPIGAIAWLAALLVRAAGIPAPIAAIIGMAILSLASAAIVERGVAERIAEWQGRGDAAATTAITTVAISFLTIVRVAAIAYVPQTHWLAVFVATALVGRWAAIFLQSIGDPIAPDSERSLVAMPAPMWLTAAISVAVAALAIAGLGKIGIVGVAFTAIAVFALGLDAQRRDGGLNAAVVAVAAAVGELTILLVATI